MLNEDFFTKIWYGKSKLYLLLLPASWAFCLVRYFRYKMYLFGWIKSSKIPKPVIVVGNISAGGTGKTMLIIELVNQLSKAGYKPGVVSRGYHGKSPVWPLSVTKNSDPILVGDEPVLISKKTSCPVVVSPSRVEACETLLNRYNCDVILSDDGLQHYGLQRDIEIAVIDGQRQYGNGHCLPAGPLREPKSRLKLVDRIVVKNADLDVGVKMSIEHGDLYDIENPEKTTSLSTFKGKKVHAVAGIGNPDSFIKEIQDEGIEVVEHCYEDHHDYRQRDFKFNDDMPVIVTEKDAVKIKSFHPAGVWVLPVRPVLPKAFYDDIIACLKLLPNSHA